MKRMCLALVLACSACAPSPAPQADPQAAARDAAAKAREAETAAQQFEDEFAKGNWELARARGDVLMAQFPGTDAARRIEAHYKQAKTKATAAREERRLASLWSYQTQPVKGGEQRSASIYAKQNVETDGGTPRPVRLIFRDHPSWGRSAYLVLETGDFNCYSGCKLKVVAGDAPPRTLPGSRPKTDEAIAMFIEDERALFRLARKSGANLAIEFPVKAGGKRTAVFEAGGLDAGRLPGWK